MPISSSPHLAPITLAEPSLQIIAARGVQVPSYDRRALAPRILHLGVGGFHRAHMAVYTDEAATGGSDWAIRGVGLLERDPLMADALGRQDPLYPVAERDNDGSTPRVVGSIVDFAFLPADEAGFARRVADPTVAILSMTITEGGYSLARRNATIETIVSALDARRAAGSRPLTILSCDNLPENGEVAREAISTVAGERSAQLMRYVEWSCSFPNSMVDRITPQTQPEDIAWVRDEIGIVDAWPVVCESFRQWVIEDAFVAGRPSWETAGVLFTDRV